MGTRYTVKLCLQPREEIDDSLAEEIERCLARIDGRMSTYRQESELSRFNRHTGESWFAVSHETATVMAAAMEISHSSQGAFDVTVGPLVDLWSFGPNPQPEHVPSEEEIEQARSRVGYRQVEVRVSPPALRKLRDEVRVDLSAIAKGFAVDALADLLSARGVGSFMIEIGGEVRTRGVKPDGTPWRIGIERPVTWARSLQLVVALRDRALATSGDYRNYYERDGKRYSHEIDPRTGLPVEHALGSVSVIADSCMLADAWATALMVAGPERAQRLAVENHLDALLILHTEDGFENRVLGNFSQYVADPSNAASGVAP